MCTALIGAIEKAGLADKSVMLLFDASPEVNIRKSKEGYSVAGSSKELCEKSDIIFMCVKPQNLADAAKAVDGAADGKTVVSIMAGVSIQKLRDTLGNVSVVRCMPNTPMMLSSGVLALSASDNVPSDKLDFIKRVLGSCCEVYEIPEELQNVSIPVHSSSPAFLFRCAEDFCEGAVRLGFDRFMALEMFCGTLIGSARMLLESGKTPAELERMVTSPGGTTKAMMDAFDAAGFNASVISAVKACKERADELGK